jgi:murein DD-endopeptidase MepM/ murein hydrolase activator NlpD
MALLACAGLALALLAAVLWWPRPASRSAPRPAPVPAATPAPLPSAAAAALAAPSATLAPSATPAPTPTPAPAPFFNDQRLTYEPGFYAPQIQAFLDSQPGPLKGISLAVGDRRHTFAEALTGQTAYYSLNPKVLLALLEVQNGLLSNANATPDQLAWAMNYRGEKGNRRGLSAQVRWATREIVHAKHDYPARVPFTFSDKSTAAPSADITLSEYAIGRVLAATTTPDRLPKLLAAFRETYTRLFGDPRPAPQGWPAPAAPFLWWPLPWPAQVTSFFDHGGPFLMRNAADGVVTYWGRREIDLAFAYNGHDGWDYAAAPPTLALAAADGDVVFAGNADDNCATRAVVLDHRNGYRTLYWHLARVDVKIGDSVTRGQQVGMVGESGCARGPHLHFGVQYLGRNIDPYGWCGAAPDPWAEHPAGTRSIWLWADRPSPCGPPPPGAVVVDDGGPGFSATGDGWKTAVTGYGGAAQFVPSVRVDPPTPTPCADAASCAPTPSLAPSPAASPAAAPAPTTPPATPTAAAVWRPALPRPGRYRVLAYVPYALSGLNDARTVRYLIRHRGGEAEVPANLELHANDWIDLGTYDFDPGDAAVTLTNGSDEAQRGVWADAMLWLPAPE